VKKLLILATFLHSGLSAQTGEAAVATAEVAKDNHWQNWTFAALALVVAASAIYVVSIDNGHEVH
jgi:hypothetical protein